MTRLIVFLAALVLVPAASAAFPAPYAVQGPDVILPSLDGSVQFTALKDAGGTRIVATRTASGSTLASTVIPGAFGIPGVTESGLPGGLFHDGSAFVLQQVGLGTTSHFAVVNTTDLSVRQRIDLKGTFGFDALSPDGSILYLIEHRTAQDWEHYVVRAYDLRTETLLAGRIADKAQKSWVMQGYAVSRATTSGGRWVYTLYANPGGYPFIHALDTVRGVAHCVGLPWTASDQDPVSTFTLALKGRVLLVRWSDGRTWRSVDPRTWRVSRP
jgi:hypothetical protein